MLAHDEGACARGKPPRLSHSGERGNRPQGRQRDRQTAAEDHRTGAACVGIVTAKNWWAVKGSDRSLGPVSLHQSPTQQGQAAAYLRQVYGPVPENQTVSGPRPKIIPAEGMYLHVVPQRSLRYDVKI